MTFLTPLLAGIVAAVAVPALVILYFLKLRRRDVEVSSTLLWKKAIEDLQANAPFQRLRRNILLLLQLVALAAVLFALAQPELRGNARVGERVIIMIDRSASMSADDGEPGRAEARVSRLEAAKKGALALVDALRDAGTFEERGDEAMVIAFDDGAEVRQNFTSDKASLRRAIEALTPTDAPTSVSRAFKLAKAYTGTQKFEEGRGFVAEGPGATIHLFSDGRLPGIEEVQTSLEDAVVYHAVGGDTPNIGVTGLQAARAFNDPGKLSVFVGLTSTDPGARTVHVRFSIDGRIVRESAVKLPGASAMMQAGTAEGAERRPGVGGVVFSLNRVEGGVVTVELQHDDRDALAVDDVGYLVFPPAKRLNVLLVSAGSVFLRDALQELDMGLRSMGTGEFQAELEGGRLGEYDVVVLDGVLPRVKPRDGKGEPAPGLPDGRYLVLGVVPPPPRGMAVVEGDGGQLIDVYERDHAALRHSGLDAIEMTETPKLERREGTPVTVLARGLGGPLIFEVAEGACRAVVVGFDPITSDWPLKPGFLVFLADALSYLGDAGVQGRMVRPGETLSERLPAGARDVRLTLPDGAAVPLTPAADGSVAYGPVTKRGVYALSWAGEAGVADVAGDGRVRRFVSANLLSAEESRIAVRAELPMAREVVSAKGAKVVAARRLWPWLLVAALGVMMLEWFVYNRRVVV